MSIFSTTMTKKSSLHKNVIWILIAVFIALITGKAIAEANWIYLIVGLIPFLIYLTVIEPFLFPFGLYVFLLPFDSILALESAYGATFTKFLGIASILALLTSGIFEKKIKKPDKAVLWWGLFVAFEVFSILWAIRPESMYERIPTATGLFLLYFIVSCYKIKKEEFNIVKNLIVFGGVAASICSIVTYFFMNVSYKATLRSSLISGESSSDPNQFAFSLLIPFALSIGTMLSARNLHMKILNWMFLGVIFFAILVTGSRGGMLGAGVIFAVYSVLSRKKVTFLTLVIPVVILIISLAPSFFFERWGTAVESGGAGRTIIWHVGLKALVEKYWLTRASLYNFPAAYTEFANYATRYVGLNRGAHNIYLMMFVELGIIGFTLTRIPCSLATGCPYCSKLYEWNIQRE